MDIKLNTVENFKRKKLVCSLLRDRVTLILGQKTNYIKTMIFCDDVRNNHHQLEKLRDNLFDVYLSINILKNALQAGEGQKVLDEVLLTVKNQLIKCI